MPEQAPTPVPVHVDWDTVTRVSRTTLTTHLWAAPPLRRSSPVSRRAYAALRDLRADNARFLSFWTHPHLGVPALHAPTETETSWDFTHLDPMLVDFMAAAEGRPVVANLAAIPSWMFKDSAPELGTDPDVAIWDYEQGGPPRDESLTEIADYFERIARWYIDGGFTDERGRRHVSEHAYRFAFWEVLCEPDVGHGWTPADYTRLYDLVVQRLRGIDPEMRFVGLSLSPITRNADYFWHFLDPANHAPGVTVDAVSHHFYAAPALGNAVGTEGNAPFDTWPATFFAQAEGFLDKVELVESIKRRLSPHTETHINEIGSFAPDVMAAEPEIPEEYWALGGAVVAYLWSRMAEMGIELVGVAEFLGYPTVIPGTTLVDWETGEPNARYRVLQLLLDEFGPGDQLVTTSAGGELTPEPPVHAQAFHTERGRRLLLVNRSAEAVTVDIEAAGRPERITAVDTGTGDGPAVTTVADDSVVVIGPFATAVVALA
ncbi:hypothetical protein [Actinoalloteichus hymeniacidonis]|uniref:D-apionate lactonase C-terminal domain-containing protein n=1 Tax=Actinoalloteichus hymeniacidonis TaxID=340345 RepID=A0AAC9HS92_9PSEU|nr:hypothetical protein [Actinoalloteichus hymeniacidonis]AOS64533.1 hypothetical protein TL08_18710 [Actinoalloteichus hymeniacidonis]MBB5907395.1 hypothetical protein [Actinoalloteichus hymeniacidonis]